MIYVVQPGDTLAAIARAQGVSVARLRSDNGLPFDQLLVPGQALVVLRPQETYEVRPGDTLYSIAGAAGLTVNRLLQCNPTLAAHPDLVPGQVLTLRLEEEPELALTVGGYAYPHVVREVLAGALPFLTDLSVFSYGFREDGTLVEPPDEGLIAQANAFGAGLMLVLTSIDESETFSTAHVSRFLHNEAVQDQVLAALLPVMEEKGYRGLDVDFEYIPEQDREHFIAFLGKARDLLHANGLVLHAALAPKTRRDQPGLLYAAHDYAAIGAIVDSVLLMTYEWGYAYGAPMAVAPLPQVREVAEYAVTEIPPWKLQLGIPNYGYDWPLPHAPHRRARVVGNQEAVTLAARVGAVIHYDEQAQAPTFRYHQDGQEHQVWFEDARSIQAKLRLAQELDLAGVGYWSLMRPFAQNWALMSQLVRVRRGEGTL